MSLGFSNSREALSIEAIFTIRYRIVKIAFDPSGLPLGWIGFHRLSPRLLSILDCVDSVKRLSKKDLIAKSGIDAAERELPKCGPRIRVDFTFTSRALGRQTSTLLQMVHFKLSFLKSLADLMWLRLSLIHI